jgi:membrane fusion protein, heavy metal efflux system
MARPIIGLNFVIAAAGLSFFALAYSFGYLGSSLKSGVNAASSDATLQSNSPVGMAAVASAPPSIELNEKQLASVKVATVGEHLFPREKSAIGSIDFNEDMTLQVFAPYQGRILELFAKVGDEVKKDQTLFTIDSPDLLAADSNLIAAAGVLELTTRVLSRVRKLNEARAASQHDVEQAVSDQQTAEGALKSARDALRIFGKSEEEIDKIVAGRMADPKLVVASPISGRVTQRNAAPGLFLQPGNPPAPFTLADISTMWMLANVPESDVATYHVGQDVKVTTLAYPDKFFQGRISTLASMVDPNTHRMLIRSQIDDPDHELRAGLFATFVIRVGDPVRSPAVPLDGVVREGDGTMTAWVTSDRRRFTQRVIKIGMQNDGYRQIVEGLQPGELVATEGAVFLSNMLVIGQAGG